LLFELIFQRYEREATMITSNLPFDEWTETFGSERLTGALLDRLTHHVHIPSAQASRTLRYKSTVKILAPSLPPEREKVDDYCAAVLTQVASTSAASFFLALHKGLHISRRDQPHLMAQLPDLAVPEMGAAASFHPHNARPQLPEETQHLVASLLLAQHRTPRGVNTVRLKHILRQIEPDRDNLRHDRSPL
jgi:hypothetical protein